MSNELEGIWLAEIQRLLLDHQMRSTLGGCVCGANCDGLVPSGKAIRDHHDHLADLLLRVVQRHRLEESLEGVSRFADALAAAQVDGTSRDAD